MRFKLIITTKNSESLALHTSEEFFSGDNAHAKAIFAAQKKIENLVNRDHQELRILTIVALD